MSLTDPESPLPTGIQLLALDPKFREDPYPILARLRKHDPVHHDTQLGRFVLTRHDDVADVLRNPDHWSDPRKALEGSFTRQFVGRDSDEEPSMLLMDDPGHRRLRNLVRHPFKPRAVDRWRERVRQVASKVVGEIDEGEFDLTARIANPIPTVVIAELLGVDPDRHQEFKRWSDTASKGAFGPPGDPADVDAAEEASQLLSQLFCDEIEKRRESPGEDLISTMVSAEETGDRLTNEEIVSQCTLLLLAGNLTTSDLIGNAVMALLQNPEQLTKLRTRPDLMQNAVEEVLRYDTPVTDSGRVAEKDLEIGGIKIGQGESLSVSLAAANRDPEIYPEPDRFDIECDDTHHQAFGGGRHFCLGAHLARLEAAETLSALLLRFPRLSLGKTGHRYASNPSFRGFERFFVVGEL